MKDIRDAFFDELYEIASKDKDVLFLTADMGAFGLEKFKRDLPNQFINMGVAEQNTVSVAAGLALGGKKVFIYSIASFISQRCYEQIKIDLCQMKLPVTIIGSGPGLTYGSDGPTHHAVNDVVIMSVLPDMTIITAQSPEEAEKAVRMAYESETPVYIRLAKGKLTATYGKYEDLYSDIQFVVHSLGYYKREGET